jgi:hypothetical protein
MTWLIFFSIGLTLISLMIRFSERETDIMYTAKEIQKLEELS